MRVYFMSPFKICSKPQQAAHGGLLHDPIVGGVHTKCTEPEAVVGLHRGGAESVRRSAIVVRGVHRKCRKPETFGKFIMGAQKT